ncbi:MAG: hypothetical protein EAZ77_16025 [Nostocales cyanobacterium]|nr:MAG: hypothetical protein EAZ77_16025 [Nostocales cyanobacterium]
MRSIFLNIFLILTLFTKLNNHLIFPIPYLQNKICNLIYKILSYSQVKGFVLIPAVYRWICLEKEMTGDR